MRTFLIGTIVLLNINIAFCQDCTAIITKVDKFTDDVKYSTPFESTVRKNDIAPVEYDKLTGKEETIIYLTISLESSFFNSLPTGAILLLDDGTKVPFPNKEIHVDEGIKPGYYHYSCIINVTSFSDVLKEKKIVAFRLGTEDYDISTAEQKIFLMWFNCILMK